MNKLASDARNNVPAAMATVQGLWDAAADGAEESIRLFQCLSEEEKLEPGHLYDIIVLSFRHKDHAKGYGPYMSKIVAVCHPPPERGDEGENLGESVAKTRGCERFRKITKISPISHKRVTVMEKMFFFSFCEIAPRKSRCGFFFRVRNKKW